MSASELIRGRVCFGSHEEYRVFLESGLEIASLPSGTLRTYGELPAVGDWVKVRPAGELALIEEVETRRSAFVRRAAGRAHDGQCVAANIDVCFVICGLDSDFNPRRIERYLVLAWESGARPVVVLNKADVCADVDAVLGAVRGIAGRAEVVAISAARSVEALSRLLDPGVTAAMLGSSGAGKTTIANALTGGVRKTREVRESDSRGRHTTTASMLMPVTGGAWLIDTPGMRELGLLASDESIELSFPEIAEIARRCHFADCTHVQEPACAIQAALEKGSISAERWASYAKLQREARHHAVEADASVQRAEKQKWKAIHKAQKRLYRDRGR